MARERARMCSRTYRGRWPSGFGRSTCHLPKVPLYEASSAGTAPQGLASCAAWASHTHTNITWRLFLAGPRSCLYCLSFPRISKFSSHVLLLKNKGHSTGPQIRAQRGPELEGHYGAAKLTPIESTPGELSTHHGDQCRMNGVGTEDCLGSRLTVGEVNCPEPCIP